jgi:hypothetical protein
VLWRRSSRPGSNRLRDWRSSRIGVGSRRIGGHFTFFTPFHCDIPTEGRPPGLTALYENTHDPTVPSVYRLEVPAGLGRLASLVNDPVTISIPFRVAASAPVGPKKAQGIIVPTGTDTQGDLSTAHRKFGLMTVAAGAV